MVNKIGWRQIHMDFHTSPLIPGIGDGFDPEAFAKVLKEAHVDSINLFARGHHGMMYYDSKKFPERVHPNLKDRGLLAKQTRALRAAGIDVNAYTTLNWDIYTVREHPEWVCVEADGKYSDYLGRNYLSPTFYINLCANTPYRDFMKEHIQEMLTVGDFNGVWIDASFLAECCCPTCLKLMEEKGLDPLNPAHRRQHSIDTNHDILRFLTEAVHEVSPDLNVMYNKSHVGFVDRPVSDAQSYFAFESLPGGEWGYMDYPVAVRYNRNEGIPTAGMTGRFHTSWGDTHSYRNKAALEYECFRMIAHGTHCIIGDQLQPSAALDEDMYKIIGEVYGSVEAKQPWLEGTMPKVEIAVVSAEEFQGAGAGSLPVTDRAACRMLTELGYQFDFIDSQKDLAKYRMIILPDVIPVDEAFAQKLDAYAANGGRIIITANSGLKPEGGFALKCMGVEDCGEAYYAPEFIKPVSAIGEGLPKREHVMYQRGRNVKAVEGTEILEVVTEPYFNRTWHHFSGHLYTASSGKTGHPAICRRDNVIYFSHPMFSIYDESAPIWIRTMMDNAIRLLLPERLIEHDGPHSVELTLMTQKEQNRDIVHVLHYIPERRTPHHDIVEDVIPLYNLNIKVRVDQSVQSITCVPDGETLPFTQEESVVNVCVPVVRGHGMIEIKYL